LQSIIDLQEKIKKTGTLTGKEFAQRVLPEGPPAVAAMPTAAVVAPGDYRTATQQWERTDLRPNGQGVKTAFPEVTDNKA
jgi:hypothetical protein